MGVMKQLGNKAFINLICPYCKGDGVYEREGIDPGHSYLEFIQDEEYECDYCGKGMSVGNPFMYGFVRN